ncbi:MAG: cation diffusion facilitator family transporter, partial [Muribaculaceae bacterium]|nr:cation diffusion facilitator family transporter [Muribaculaceae bacterium]
KYETLASALIGLLLGVVGIGIAVDGISKIIKVINGEVLPKPGMIALVAAVLSVLSKEWLFHYTMRSVRLVHSSALKANAWHHRSDALTSIATLIGIGGAILLGNKFTVLDPVAAVVVSGFVIKAAYNITVPAIYELTEASLSPEEYDEISRLISSNPEVKNFHRLRTRRIGNKRAVEMHIKLPANYSLKQAHEVASVIERKIRNRFGQDTLVTVHMEPYTG